MTILEDPREGVREAADAVADGGLGDLDAAGSADAEAGDPTPQGDEDEVEPLPRPTLKALGVAFLSGTAAALSVGGIFASWPARGLALAALAVGIGWAWVCATRPGRRVFWQALIVPITGGLTVLSVAVGAGGESPGALVAKAIASGRALSIPVPFDPGWRPVIIAVFVTLGFATAWVGVRIGRPQTSLLLPLPIVALALVSQPPDGQIVAGFLGLVPLLGAATLLFGNQGGGADLGREFEVRRLLRSVGLAIPLLGVVLLLAQTSFLFPPPVYDPTNKPQKPKSIPLSAARDRVLFEVEGPITGPWVIGALDVYDGTDWRLGPFDSRRLEAVPGDGVVDSQRAQDITVSFTTRDLGDSATFPAPATPAKGVFTGGVEVLFDPRTETFRVRSGRVPTDFTYSVLLPTYPTQALLRTAPESVPPDIEEFLSVPPAPPAVADLLATAPTNRWDRLEVLRKALNDVVVASGAGAPGPVPPATVQELLAGDHEGTPFEIVAAEALLARWAGVPSRIGFGFDGGQKETVEGREVTTLRPKNAAQFLEVWFEGYGWIPLVSTPPKAKTSLESDPNQVTDPTIQPSDDVAVQLVIPLETQSLTFVYDTVRFWLVRMVPVLLVLLALYLSLPGLQKWRRTNLRRRWAQERGPRWEIAAAYAELRDVATDLSIGDPLDSPLEYRQRVVADVEHDELAWLVARVMYGDMGSTVGPDDAFAAWEMSASLRRRLTRAQPRQTQILAWLSRASLLEPYSDEVPNLRALVPRLPRRRPVAALRRWRRALLGRRRRPALVPARVLGKTQAAAAAISARGRS